MRLHGARQMFESIYENGALDANTSYYLFFGNHDPAITVPPTILESEEEVTFDPYQNMIAGKRVSNADIALVIRNIPYVSSVVYDMYDDKDDELLIKNYYVITEEGSYFHVYKCLDNNMGAVSSVQPDFSHITGSNTIVYQTSDGYRWKYMYSVSDSQELKFGTSDYFPVFANSAVSGNAVSGTVDIIKVEGAGKGYDNYIEGTFQTSEIRVGGNGQIYEISNTDAKISNNFYNGCLLYLTNGTGAGQFANITNYICNTSGNFIVISSSFSTAPTNGTEYEVYPQVIVHGTGYQQVNCSARALVNALSSNSVYRVEVIDRGSGYTDLITATAYADPAVGVTLPAELRPINSPPLGHGKDAAKELGSNTLIFSVKISNTENDTIPAVNSFKQIGILKDPVFANVNIETKNKVGNFGVGETLYRVTPIRVDYGATTLTTTANVDCVDADFNNQFAAGEWVYLAANDSSGYQLTTIDSITNSSQIVLAVNSAFNSTNCLIYRVELQANGTVKSSNTTHVLLNDVYGVFAADDIIVGNISAGYAQVNTVNISNTAKGFDTFVQMYKYYGALNSGTFQDDEYVWQTAPAFFANTYALLHSSVIDGANVGLYVTDQKGEFRVGGSNTIQGNTSTASMTISYLTPPELKNGSGDILFLENVDDVTRSNTTSETFQVVITF
jgi:hypothetical protein